MTDGPDRLRDRFIVYAGLEARVATWRAVALSDEGQPTATCAGANARVPVRRAL